MRELAPPQEWIEFTDDSMSWPEDGQRIVYWFEPFSASYIGRYYRPEDDAGRRGSIVGQIGFCEPYEATHWLPVIAKVTLKDHESSHWLSVLSEKLNEDPDRKLKEMMVHFIRRQDCLDPECEKILYKNLSELYEQ